MFINTSRAFVLTLALLFIGFIWATFQPDAPYPTFAGTVGLAFGALAGKRLAQKANWAQKEGGRMKKYIKPALIVFAFLLLALFVLERACSSPDEKYFELKSQYESYKEETEKEQQEAQKQEREKEAEIAKKEAEISNLKDKILDLEEERGEIAKKDSEKASRIKELEAQRVPLVDKDAIIKNQDLQITEWKDRFFNEREDKNKVIEQRDFWARIAFKEKAKYSAEKGISKRLRERLEREENLRILAEELNEQNEKRFNRLKFGSTVKTVLIVGSVIAGGYVILKEID